MEFNILAALVAGFVATIVMTLMMKASTAAGMTDMPPMPLVSGTMFSGDRDTAKRIGAFVHFIAMGTVVLGIAYAALFSAFGTASWLAGLVIGLVHGAMVGLVGMPMMGSVHPRMTATAEPRGRTVVESAGEVAVVAPGVFGKNWGGITPAGMLMGHAIYGLILALVYSAIA
ncbi:MAG: hypothetical protein M3N57_04030 [Actinomycetota bacterium]|nr:hypothetical protein [Actinomycetota bacterium]